MNDKKTPVYVFAVSYKLPSSQYSGWSDDEPGPPRNEEAEHAAWEETRALMDRLVRG